MDEGLAVSGVNEAREELSAAVKEVMRTAKSVPNVDGWEPQTALLMGALYAVEAITLAEPELVLRALGMKQAGLDLRMRDKWSSSWLLPNTNPFKEGDDGSGRT